MKSIIAYFEDEDLMYVYSDKLKCNCVYTWEYVTKYILGRLSIITQGEPNDILIDDKTFMSYYRRRGKVVNEFVM